VTLPVVQLIISWLRADHVEVLCDCCLTVLTLMKWMSCTLIMDQQNLLPELTL